MRALHTELLAIFDPRWTPTTFVFGKPAQSAWDEGDLGTVHNCPEPIKTPHIESYIHFPKMEAKDAQL